MNSTELGLSHIINAEGEKLQYALGTITGMPAHKEPLTMDELLKLNESVHKTLDSAMMNQFFLKEKLTGALSSSVMQGEQGTGTLIKGSYPTIEDLKKENPDGPPEDAYLVDGKLYIWSKEKGWHSVGDLRGPQGIGTLIKGTYPTLEDLQDENPDGPPEDGYLIDGKLYVWTKEEGWHSAGDLRGPQGTGTLIKGTYPTLEDLKNENPDGPPEDAYIIDAELYIWTEGKGWHSAGSLRGPQGIATLIKGSYPTLEELKTENPDGPPEDAYLVDGKLYVWTKEEGWHSVGDLRGPAATSYTIIPFASTEAPYSYASNGEPTTVSLLGFGYGDRRGEPGPIGLADYSIKIEPNNQSFTLNRANSNQNKQVVFSLPFNMLIKSIYITVGTSAEWNFPSKAFPYIQLYMADPGTNNFVVIPRAIAVPTDSIGPGRVVADTMREASIDGLNIPLKAGTRIAIGAMVRTEESTVAQEGYWLYFTGAIGMAYNPDPMP